jgi:hypothetical protein
LVYHEQDEENSVFKTLIRYVGDKDQVVIDSWMETISGGGFMKINLI